MPTRADIVVAARAYLGTPFRHQGRVLGRGVDCAGLVLGVAHTLGLSTFQHVAYGRIPHSMRMVKMLDQQAVPRSGVVPGCILLMSFDGEPQHLGIASDIGVIHSYSLIGRCVEHGIDALWVSRIRGTYDFPGVGG